MWYLVSGASKQSGADVRLVVDASSEEEAAGMANAMGLLVARVAVDPLYVQFLQSASGQPVVGGGGSGAAAGSRAVGIIGCVFAALAVAVALVPFLNMLSFSFGTIGFMTGAVSLGLGLSAPKRDLKFAWISMGASVGAMLVAMFVYVLLMGAAVSTAGGAIRSGFPPAARSGR